MNEVSRIKGPAEGNEEAEGGSDSMSREAHALATALGRPTDAINYGALMLAARAELSDRENRLLDLQRRYLVNEDVIAARDRQLEVLRATCARQAEALGGLFKELVEGAGFRGDAEHYLSLFGTAASRFAFTALSSPCTASALAWLQERDRKAKEEGLALDIEQAEAFLLSRKAAAVSGWACRHGDPGRWGWMASQVLGAAAKELRLRANSAQTYGLVALAAPGGKE